MIPAAHQQCIEHDTGDRKEAETDKKCRVAYIVDDIAACYAADDIGYAVDCSVECHGCGGFSIAV